VVTQYHGCCYTSRLSSSESSSSEAASASSFNSDSSESEDSSSRSHHHRWRRTPWQREDYRYREPSPQQCSPRSQPSTQYPYCAKAHAKNLEERNQQRASAAERLELLHLRTSIRSDLVASLATFWLTFFMLATRLLSGNFSSISARVMLLFSRPLQPSCQPAKLESTWPREPEEESSDLRRPRWPRQPCNVIGKLEHPEARLDGLTIVDRDVASHVVDRHGREIGTAVLLHPRCEERRH